MASLAHLTPPLPPWYALNKARRHIPVRVRLLAQTSSTHTIKHASSCPGHSCPFLWLSLCEAPHTSTSPPMLSPRTLEGNCPTRPSSFALHLSTFLSLVVSPSLFALAQHRTNHFAMPMDAYISLKTTHTPPMQIWCTAPKPYNIHILDEHHECIMHIDFYFDIISRTLQRSG